MDDILIFEPDDCDIAEFGNMTLATAWANCCWAQTKNVSLTGDKTMCGNRTTT